MKSFLSNRSDYALRAVLELAKREGHGPVKVPELADFRTVPLRFLENILLDLRRGGLVESRRGARGGYWLARPASEITVGDVIRLLDGPFSATSADRSGESQSPGLRELWDRIGAALAGVMERTTFGELVEIERRALSHGTDFVI